MSYEGDYMLERIREIRQINEKVAQVFNELIGTLTETLLNLNDDFTKICDGVAKYLEEVNNVIERFIEHRDEEFFRGPEFNDLALVLEGKRAVPKKKKGG